ncbi:hypothetical protein Bca52824_078997 [Brassica carinata]|uniref:Uncharacterized protein n=1 Tax=Brassica carinata TaxID=52824 RepID=A0A8X7PYZ6_BRACI|nr:hypothetical protein Bca52824_078997 [Brassica carinata]
MEDDCALVVVLRSSSIPPASSRFWVSSEFPGGDGDSLLVVFPCTWMHGSLWLEGVAVKLMRRAELFFSS